MFFNFCFLPSLIHYYNPPMKKNILFCLAAVSTISLFNSCKKEAATQYGNIMVNMTDAPASAYQKVNVDIQQVSIHMVPAPNNVQWMNLPTHAGVYDLLSLQNGIDTTIVQTNQLPAGKIMQMRLLLGTNNSVMINNIIYPMTVPSGTQTGIKINGTLSVTANTTLQVLLDFDANKSVIDKGNNEYQLQPDIKTL